MWMLASPGQISVLRHRRSSIKPFYEFWIGHLIRSSMRLYENFGMTGAASLMGWVLGAIMLLFRIWLAHPPSISGSKVLHFLIILFTKTSSGWTGLAILGFS